jgi:hypothetical protein
MRWNPAETTSIIKINTPRLLGIDLLDVAACSELAKESWDSERSVA